MILSKFMEDIQVYNESQLVDMVRDYVSYLNADSLQIIQRDRMHQLEREISSKYERGSEDEKKDIILTLEKFNAGPMGSKPLDTIIRNLTKKKVVNPVKAEDWDQKIGMVQKPDEGKPISPTADFVSGV